MSERERQNSCEFTEEEENKTWSNDLKETQISVANFSEKLYK